MDSRNDRAITGPAAKACTCHSAHTSPVTSTAGRRPTAGSSTGCARPRQPISSPHAPISCSSRTSANETPPTETKPAGSAPAAHAAPATTAVQSRHRPTITARRTAVADHGIAVGSRPVSRRRHTAHVSTAASPGPNCTNDSAAGSIPDIGCTASRAPDTRKVSTANAVTTIQGFARPGRLADAVVTHAPDRSATASSTAATPPDHPADDPRVIVSGPGRRRHTVHEPTRPAGGEPAGLIGLSIGQGSGPPAAMADRVANSSPLSDAPPTRAPSISVCLVSSPTFLAFTEPP